MSDLPTHDPGETVPTLPGTEPADDDFLFHLYRGSEFLMQDRVVEAKGELERALALQPQDAKGQDLLAGVYFRLGLYPRAIEIWQRLVGAYPREPALRINLALVLLKTGQPADAVAHIHTALQIRPDHDRAWGYLGLIEWRLANFSEAREAFLRGGQGAMARRMEEVVGTAASPIDPQEPANAERDRAAMRWAAEKAIQEFEAEQVAIAVDGVMAARPTGLWRVAEPGAEATPGPVRPTVVRPIASPPTLGALLEGWLVSLPERTSLAVSSNGDLFMHAAHDIYSRLEGVRALRGELRTSPVHRRARGKDQKGLLGGSTPLLLWRGPVSAIIRPREGARFHALHLDDETLYIREELVFAFSDSLSFESGTLPLQKGEDTSLLQLYGSGDVVLSLRGAPSALRVEQGQEVRVAPEALLGWTGRVLPRRMLDRATESHAASAPPLAFVGDGVLLVT